MARLERRRCGRGGVARTNGGGSRPRQGRERQLPLAPPGTQPSVPTSVLVVASIVRSLHGTAAPSSSPRQTSFGPRSAGVRLGAFTAALGRSARSRHDALTGRSSRWRSPGTRPVARTTATARSTDRDDFIRRAPRPGAEAARILAFAMPPRSMHRSRAGTRSSPTGWCGLHTSIPDRAADRAAESSIYPSGHSCITAAVMSVLAAAFPQERARLEAMVEDAGMSRVYGGHPLPSTSKRARDRTRRPPRSRSGLAHEQRSSGGPPSALDRAQRGLVSHLDRIGR